MIEALVRACLGQRLVVLVVAAIFLVFGLNAARKLSVDAFPDVTNVQVQIATDAPGRSPEEVERFATVPLEIAMTGLPGLTEMRSLNKPDQALPQTGAHQCFNHDFPAVPFACRFFRRWLLT